MSAQPREEQIRRICQAGVEPANIFCDDAPDRQAELTGLTSLQERVARGDVVLVSRLDRLGRNLSASIRCIEYFNTRGVILRFLDDGFDTEHAQGAVVVAVLTAVERAERRRLGERTREGRIEAREKGVKFGRKPSIDREKIQTMRLQGIRASEIARQMKIGRSTVYKILQSLLKGGTS